MSLSRTQMPSLQELTAFEVAGRHGSFTRAAEELSLTQSAVSKQIRELEATLGVALFERVKGRVLLTQAGREFLGSVRGILIEYAAAAHSVIAASGSEQTLRLRVLPTFATRWLVPRLPDFLREFPGLNLQLVTASASFDMGAAGVDVAIYFGQPNWAQVEVTRLCEESVVAVASPDYIRRLRIERTHDLARATLLQQASRPNLWREWMAGMGIDHPNPMRGPLFDQFAMTCEAAVAGLGVALMPDFLVERELNNGSLVPVADAPSMRGTGAYYVIVPLGRQREPAVMGFIDWLVEQAASSMRTRMAAAAARQAGRSL